MSSPTARAGVEVQYRATGVEAIKRGNMELMRSSDQMKQRIGSASTQIASGLEMIARQGKLTGESMKQIANQAGQMAFMFGPQGAIAGALAVTGVAIFSFFTRTRDEIRKTREAAEQEMKRMVDAGDFAALNQQLRQLFTGTASNRYEDGITARERRFTELGSQLAAVQDDKAAVARIVKEREAIRRQLAEDYRRANELRAIIMDPRTGQLPGMGGLAPVRTTANAPGRTAPGGLPGAANLPGLSTALASTPGTFASGIGAFAGSNVTLRAGGATNAADLIASNEMEQQIIAGAQRLAEVAQVNIGQIVGEGLANGFAQAFSGEGVSGIIKGFGATVLSSIGSLFQQMGAAYLQFGQIMSWATALYNPATAGAAGLALGVALMALGGALQGLASGGRGGGGGIGAAVTATSTTIDRGLINPLNPLATSVSPRQSNVFHVGVINPHDPATQRVVQQTIRNAGNMGGV